MEVLKQIINCVDKEAHNIKHEEGDSGWSHICGGVGGDPFVLNNPKYTLVGVRGSYGAFVEGIQFLFADTQTNKLYETDQLGGPGPQPFEIMCQEGEQIIRVYIWSNEYIVALQFDTNRGRKSHKFGGEGGKLHVIDAFEGRLCGVKGRSSKLIDQLTFAIES